MSTAIVVHGGAGGWRLGPEQLRTAIQACEEAVGTGQWLLLRGSRALDAVEVAVRVLEDAPVLNAGRGSYPNTAGQVEMDALIMDGARLDLGAVAAVRRVRNPVSLARRVMEASGHALLVGEGAERFAVEIGFPLCSPEDLLIGRAAEPSADTVGAVALDRFGTVAAAASTGGIRGKRPGRVGDTPLVGSGAYADNEVGAATATGNGEALMKVLIARQVCDYLAQGMEPHAACEAALRNLERRVAGTGGLIALDRRGRIGVAFNTPGMPYAWAVDDGRVVSGWRKD